MIETHTRILGIAPYDGMRTAMEQAAQAYPNVEMDIYTGDLEDGQAIVQQMPPNSYDCIISRGGTAALIRQVTDLPVVDIHISVYDVREPLLRGHRAGLQAADRSRPCGSAQRGHPQGCGV